MSFALTYLTVALGIVISVVLPILRQFLPKPPIIGGVAAVDQTKTVVKQYLVLVLLR